MSKRTPEETRAAILKIVAEAVATAGKDGVPSGHLYTMLMGYGCTLNAYDNIIGLLKSQGLVVERARVLYAKEFADG